MAIQRLRSATRKFRQLGAPHQGLAVCPSGYRELILDHYSHPRNRGELAQPDIKVEGANPLCGDELSNYVKLDGATISDVRFVGRSCSISQESLAW